MQRWVCLRCFQSNDDAALNCTNCGLLRGATPPPGTEQQPPTIASRAGGIGSLVRRFGWIGVVVAIAVVGGIFAARRDDSGAITQSGSMAIVDLRVGDCFDHQDSQAAEASEVDAKPCAESHQFELIFAGDMTAASYPTEAQFDDFVSGNCLSAFDSYVGLAYESSRLDIFWYFPTEDGWGEGDHSVQCAVFDPLDSELTGSLRGASR